MNGVIALFLAGIATFLLWQTLNGLITGRLWVAPRHLFEESDIVVYRDREPPAFWGQVILNVVFGVFLATEAVHQMGWINADPAAFLERVFGARL